MDTTQQKRKVLAKKLPLPLQNRLLSTWKNILPSLGPVSEDPFYNIALPNDRTPMQILQGTGNHLGMDAANPQMMQSSMPAVPRPTANPLFGATPESSYHPFSRRSIYAPSPAEQEMLQRRREAYEAYQRELHGPPYAGLAGALNDQAKTLPPKVKPLQVQRQGPPMDEQGKFHYDWPDASGWVHPPSFYSNPKAQVVMNAVKKVASPIARVAGNIASFFRNNT